MKNGIDRYTTINGKKFLSSIVKKQLKENPALKGLEFSKKGRMKYIILDYPDGTKYKIPVPVIAKQIAESDCKRAEINTKSGVIDREKIWNEQYTLFLGNLDEEERGSDYQLLDRIQNNSEAKDREKYLVSGKHIFLTENDGDYTYTGLIEDKYGYEISKYDL